MGIELNELYHARDIAIQAAEMAGDLAKLRFKGQLGVKTKDDAGDLVTEVDLLADHAIVMLITEAFPTHQVYSEEAGESGQQSAYVWHVDPLDGTNNYAIGMPLYGVSISLSYNKQTILGVVRDSHLQETYWAIRENGTWHGDERVISSKTVNFSKSTISWIQGHGVGKSDSAALKLRHQLEFSFKRVIRLWAPSLTWAMLARGDLGGIVLYKSEGEDLFAGVLIAMEAGVKVTDIEGRTINNWERAVPCLVAAHPDDHDQLLSIVRESLKDNLDSLA